MAEIIIQTDSITTIIQEQEDSVFVVEEIENVTIVEMEPGVPGPPGVNTWGSLTGDVEDQQDLIDYINGRGFLTAVDLVGYATQGWVNSQGFLKTESDTLQSVTGRGATTTIESTFSGGLITNQIKGVNTSGITVKNHLGQNVALFGAGGSQGATFYDGVTFNSLTQGSVPFIGSGGLLSQDNANFFYDDTNNRLGVGTSSLSSNSIIEARKDQPSYSFITARNDNASGFSGFSLWGNGSEAGRMQYNCSSPNIFFTTIGAIPFYIGTNNAVRMTVSSAGNVGIGITAPTTLLQVGGAGGSTGSFDVKNGDGSSWFNVAGGIVSFNAMGGSTRAGGIDLGARFNIAAINDSYPTLAVRGYTGGVSDIVRVSSPTSTTGDYFVIKSGGNVGIGTTTPDKKLTIYQPADDNGIRIYGYDDKITSWLDIKLNGNGLPVLDTSASVFYFGKSLGLTDNYSLQLGSWGQNGIRNNTGGYGSLQLFTAVGGSGTSGVISGYINIMNVGGINNANRYPTSSVADATLRIYSSDVTQANDYIQFSHNQTDAVIGWGNGNLNFGNYAYLSKNNQFRVGGLSAYTATVEVESTNSNGTFALEAEQFNTNEGGLMWNGGDVRIAGYNWDTENFTYFGGMMYGTGSEIRLMGITIFEDDVLFTGGAINVPNSTPASSSATGTVGDMKADANYIYRCTTTNTWKRAALSAF